MLTPTSGPAVVIAPRRSPAEVVASLLRGPPSIDRVFALTGRPTNSSSPTSIRASRLSKRSDNSPKRCVLHECRERRSGEPFSLSNGSRYESPGLRLASAKRSGDPRERIALIEDLMPAQIRRDGTPPPALLTDHEASRAARCQWQHDNA